MSHYLLRSLLLHDSAISYDPLAIDSATLTNGATNTAYPSTTLTVTGGSGTVTWSVTSGALPTGMSINSSTGEISGTPTASHSGNIEFTATDAIASDSDSITLALIVVEPVLYMPTDQLNNVLALCNIAGAEWTDSVGGTQATAGQDIAYLEDLSGYDEDIAINPSGNRPQFQSDHWAITNGSADYIDISEIASLINNRQEFELYLPSNPTWTASNLPLLELTGNGVTVRLRRTAGNQYWWYVDSDTATANQTFGGTTSDGFQVNRIKGTSTALIVYKDDVEQVSCDYTTGDYDFTTARIYANTTSETYGIFLFKGNHNSVESAAMQTWCENRYNTPASFTALGYGSSATGGATGTTYTVTALTDTLPNGVSGELRWALGQTGTRIVEFDSALSGWIELNEKIIVSNDNLTIDGSTAANKGIGIKFSDSATVTSANGSMIQLGCDNVIIHDVRFYPGNTFNTTADLDLSQAVGANVPFYENDAIGIFGCNNVLIYHCQFGGHIDGGIELWSSSSNVTIQECLIHMGLDESTHSNSYTWNGSAWEVTASHSMASLCGNGCTGISYINNVMIDCGDRVPNISTGGNFELLGNIVWNTINSTMKLQPTAAANGNIVGNWTSQNGPDTSHATDGVGSYFVRLNSNVTYYEANNRVQYNPTGSTVAFSTTRIYTNSATDNVTEIALSTDTSSGFEDMDTTAKLMAKANNVGVTYGGSDAWRTEVLSALETAADLTSVPSSTPSRYVNDLVTADYPSLA